MMTCVAVKRKNSAHSYGFIDDSDQEVSSQGSLLRRRTTIVVAVAVFLIMGTSAAQRAQAQVESTVYNFMGYNGSSPATSDGASSNGYLIRDSSGNLYGTTYAGGLSAAGTVFELVFNSTTNSYTEQVLYSFAGGATDGAKPYAGLIRDSSGNLYGTTYAGGLSAAGTVFELVFNSTTNSYTEQVLYSFAGGTTDGVAPYAGLLMDSSGNLYGTTTIGGSSNYGTVFELVHNSSTNTYTEKLLYSFTGGTDGVTPYAGLLMDSSGNLYGTTTIGGSSNAGTVFELVFNSTTNSYTEQLIYSFAGGTADGAQPYAGLIRDSSGNFYGTTFAGGSSNAGTVFELVFNSTTNSYTERVLYSFAGGTTDGVYAYSTLVRDLSGNLYATTAGGGSSGSGTVYELVFDSAANSYTEQFLHNFKNTDGLSPKGGLAIDPSGNLYGGTLYGGSPSYGVVFGIAPVTISTPSINFGVVGVGTTSTGQTVTVTNIGTGTVTYGAASLSGANAADFTIVTDGCEDLPVAPGGACSVSVTFKPSATGGESALLNLAENGLTQTVSLAGTGTVPTAAVSPTSITFSSQPVGTTSSAQTVTVTNTGTVTLHITSVAGTNDFQISSNTCTTPVDVGKSCTVGATFTPLASGPRTGTLTFTDDAADSPQSVALSGTGSVTTVSISPATLTFGSQAIGTQSANQIVTVTNTGATANLAFVNISVSNNFVIDSAATTCSTSAMVAPGSSCQVAVAFKPATAGTLPGSLTLTDNALPTTQTVALSGTAPGVTLNPSSVSFSGTAVGGTSAAQTVTLANTGNSSVTITGISVSGEFAIASAGTTCSTSTPVAASGSCAIALTFSPDAAGTNTGVLTVSDNATNSPQTVALLGNGQDFTFTVGTTSQTVASGSAGNYSLQLSPENGFNQAINLACSGAPQGATCTVTPSLVTLDGTNNAPVSVKVTTTAASTLGPGPGNFVPPPGAVPIGMWLGILGLFGLISMARLTPKGGRLHKVTPFAVVVLLVTLWAACGGGGSSTLNGTNNAATPAGTYVLTVNAKSGNLNHSVQVVLTVQ